MRLFCFVVCFNVITSFTKAQTVHSIGLGAFGTVPMVSGNHPYADKEYFLVRPSFFANYTLELRYLNFSVGAGNWNSTFMYDIKYDSSFANPKGGEGTEINSLNYVFSPVTAGINIVTNEDWEVVVEGMVLLKYLYVNNFDVESDDPAIAKAVRPIRSGNLDALGYNRFSTSVGGGFYIEYHIGSFIPKLQLGYVTDMKNVFKSSNANYKFAHPYAAFFVNYVLKYYEKINPWDRRVRW